MTTAPTTMQWGYAPSPLRGWGYAPSPLRGWGYPHPLAGVAVPPTCGGRSGA
jgi:hypothetical protein